MTDPSIGVVIPARNAAAELAATLASVAGQTLVPAEVVVVDDGSTDGTGDVARAWEGRLPIQVLRHDASAGVSASRNAAVAALGADLVALLDADDVWLPDHLATMAAVHAARPGLVTADPLRWIPGRAVGEPWSARQPLPPVPRQLGRLLRENYVFAGTLFTRAAFADVGGFRTELRRGEDWELWLRMAKAGMPISRPGHPTLLYRLREGSAMTKDDQATDAVRVLELAGEGLVDPDARKSLRIGLRRARAEASLYAAYAAAGDGSTTRARILGARAVGGDVRVAVRGAAMAVLPRQVAARRAATHYDPEVWLKR